MCPAQYAPVNTNICTINTEIIGHLQAGVVLHNSHDEMNELNIA